MKAIENNSNHNSLSSETPNHIIKNQPAQVVGRLTMGPIATTANGFPTIRQFSSSYTNSSLLRSFFNDLHMDATHFYVVSWTSFYAFNVNEFS